MKFMQANELAVNQRHPQPSRNQFHTQNGAVVRVIARRYMRAVNMAAKHISRPKSLISFERVPPVCKEQRNKLPVSRLSSTRQRTRPVLKLSGCPITSSGNLTSTCFVRRHSDYRQWDWDLRSRPITRGYRPRVRDKGIRDGDSVPIASRHDRGNGCTNHHYAIQSRFAAADDVVWLRVNRDATTPVTRRLASDSDTRTLAHS